VASFFKRSPNLPSAPVTVTLIGKPGCHLCDDARETVRRVADETGAVVEEQDITAEDYELALRDEYWEQIPVTLVNGARHDFWRVDPDRLRKAIAAAARR
jgi:glutaredoxin